MSHALEKEGRDTTKHYHERKGKHEGLRQGHDRAGKKHNLLGSCCRHFVCLPCDISYCGAPPSSLPMKRAVAGILKHALPIDTQEANNFLIL